MIKATLKRPASEEPDMTTANKRAKTASPDTADDGVKTKSKSRANNKSCKVCYETGTTFPKSSANCKSAHGNDICKLCYTQHILVKFMDDVDGKRKCPHEQCKVSLSLADIKRILSHKNYLHYEFRVNRARAERDGLIVCVSDFTDAGGNVVSCNTTNAHDVETGGRIFHCTKCGDKQCVACGVREHEGETCQAFQTRLLNEHGHEEAATARMLQNGCVKSETGREKIDNKIKPCPCCGILIEKIDKCPHVTCEKCANQFCFRCNAPYFGHGGVYELGNAAHQPHCVYYQREKEDRRCKRRKKVAESDVAAGEDGEKGLGA